MTRYDHTAIEAKWQGYWERNQTFATPTDRTRPKYYVLDMFPYPSGAGLHVGHPKGYVATDVVARARRMMGFNVLHPMGWDSFGLPAERQAVAEGLHPKEVTRRNIATFKGQLQRLGLSYDWGREVETSSPEFYRWTQWIFRKLHQRGLAYEANVPVNWCPALGTVLANEEVNEGRYIETGDPVEKRNMKQWMLKITAYAERLVQDLALVDWPEGIKEMQRDWIGRSEGVEVTFRISAGEGQITGRAGGPALDDPPQFTVFTTRSDTLFGCTYCVLAPEHPLIDAITTAAQRPAIAAYREKVGRMSDRDRTAQAADAPKTGAFTGAYAVNPVNGERVPVWIADYVLGSYGTGAVFACPAHDERDHAFATTFGLPILEVVAGGDVQVAAYTGDGPHVNSAFLDGLDVTAALAAVATWLEERGVGRRKVNYRLRDWLFSRQRYWGEPFPILHLDDGTERLLGEDELPVLLPHLDDFRPTEAGNPPLARSPEWVAVVDPKTGRAATRETNTMPQWAGSCWYYLRFVDPRNSTAAWDPGEERYWMPVDLYVGGAEHAVLHLLYARFWHKVLYDVGEVHTPEPFHRLVNQGMIHATAFNESPEMRGKFFYPADVEQTADGWRVKADGRLVHAKMMKMSKSRYNVTNPDDMCREYGADAMRLYELFMGPLEDGALWEDSGVAGTRRFLDRTWRIAWGEDGAPTGKLVDEPTVDRDLERALHAAIKKVTESVESLRFNTAIAEMMTFANHATRAQKVPKAWFEAFVLVLSPFAPHIAEEMWAALGHSESLAYAKWPAFDVDKLAVDTITVAVQVNGRLRGTVELPAGVDKEAAIAAARADPAVARWLDGATVRREVYVPGKLVNLVIEGPSA